MGQANMESAMNASAIAMAHYAESEAAEAARKTEQEAERRFKEWQEAPTLKEMKHQRETQTLQAHLQRAEERLAA